MGLVLWRRKAEDAIPVIREPVLSLEQKTSAKRSQLRVAWAKGQAVTALSGSIDSHDSMIRSFVPSPITSREKCLEIPVEPSKDVAKGESDTISCVSSFCWGPASCPFPFLPPSSVDWFGDGADCRNTGFRQ